MADKFQAIEEEMKLLKNEIKQVLIDIKERLENPVAGRAIPVHVVKTVSMSPEKATVEESSPQPKAEAVGDAPAPGANGNGRQAHDVLATAGVPPASVVAGGNGNGNGNGKAAHEATAAQGSGISTGPVTVQPAINPSIPSAKPAADLLTVSMLSQWLATGVKKVGKQRMEALLDIYGQLGGLSSPLKDALMKLLNTDEGDGQSMREGISLLVEVDNLVRRSLTDRSEAAILSLFMNSNGNGKQVSHG
ncbi:MAG: hypothetical protein HY671_02620 [Chloroflexi bacterium]|nr:hypothetical protein [Chloroflexota bacterium]